MSFTTTENIHIKPCCKFMADTLMMNDIRCSIIMDLDEPKGSQERFNIVWSDGDCIPLMYCPSCGKRIEEEDE